MWATFGWRQSPKVWGEISRFFKEIFFYSEALRPTLDRVCLSRLSLAEAESLLVRFSPSEVDEGIDEMDLSKSPSFGGFNFFL